MKAGQTLSLFPTDIVGWISFIGFIIFGFIALYGVFDKRKKEREAEANQVDDRVIFLLKEQVSALEKKVEVQAHLLEETARKLDALMTENKTLKDILQGRDKAALDYQALGREAMKRGEEIYKLVHEIKQTVDRLAAQSNVNVTVTK